MIIKEHDSIELTEARLEGLMALPGVTAEQKKQLEDELWAVRQGYKGERDAAHYLDRVVRDHPNRVIIHDLRLEHNGEIAQIDHLLINRMFGIYILESKNFSDNIEINDLGEFAYWSNYKRRFVGMPSPIEQAKRQEQILRAVIRDKMAVPSRLGIRLKPEFHTRILVGVSSQVKRPKKFDTSSVTKVDLFFRDYEADQSVASTARNVFSTFGKDVIIDFAQTLAAMHQPHQIDYVAKYGLAINVNAILGPAVAAPPPVVADPVCAAQGYCIRCAEPIGIDPRAPYCPKCYRSWARWKNTAYEDSRCHICNTENKSTILKPACPSCYRQYKTKLQWPAPA